MRFRVLEVGLQALLVPSASASASEKNPLIEALRFCGEEEALPDGVRVFANALPGTYVRVATEASLCDMVVGW